MTRIESQIVDGVVRASFNSVEIRDEVAIREIGAELMKLITQASETKKLLLSFKGVKIMSSAMIGKLVLLNKASKSHCIQLKFCEIDPNVLEVFRITRMGPLGRKED